MSVAAWSDRAASVFEAWRYKKETNKLGLAWDAIITVWQLAWVQGKGEERREEERKGGRS